MAACDLDVASGQKTADQRLYADNNTGKVAVRTEAVRDASTRVSLRVKVSIPCRHPSQIYACR